MAKFVRVLFGCLVLTVSGCGSSSDLLGIQGKVALDGQPVEMGVVSFIPTSGEAGAVGTAITNGSYELSKERGLRPGSYRVEIRWPKPTGRQTVDPDTKETVPVTVDAVPAKFNATSELTVEISSGSTTQDFDLTS